MTKNKKMKIKAIAIDLDGTLLNSSYEISETCRQALHDLEKAAIKIVLATGRRYGIGAHFARNVGIEGPMIFQNGAVIKEVKNRETIFYRTIPTDMVRKVVQIGITEGYSPICFCSPKGRGGVLLLNIRDAYKPIQRYLRASWNDVEVVSSPDRFYRPDITQVMFSGEIEKIRSLSAVYKQSLAHHAKILLTEYPHRNLSILDIMQRDASKGAALRIVAKLWNIDMQQVAAIGDNFNDLDMLDIVRYPMVMGNADKVLKEKFPRVLPSNEQSGVAFGIWKYIIPKPSRLKEWASICGWDIAQEVVENG